MDRREISREDTREVKTNTKLNLAHSYLIYAQNVNTELLNEVLKFYLDIDYNIKFSKTNAIKCVKTDLKDFRERGIISSDNEQKVFKYIKRNK